MPNIRFFLLFLFLLFGTLSARDHYMLSLDQQPDLAVGQGFYEIGHRFQGHFLSESIDTFFGYSGGVNVGLLGIYALPWNHLNLKASYRHGDQGDKDFAATEYALGLKYPILFTYPPLNPFRFQLSGDYFTFLNQQKDRREGGLFFVFSSELVREYHDFYPVVNLAYDTFTNRSGMGVGTTYTLSETQFAVGEFYLANGYRSAVPVWTLGYRKKHLGHEYLFSLSNSGAMGTRASIQGTAHSDLFFGFQFSSKFMY